MNNILKLYSFENLFRESFGNRNETSATPLKSQGIERFKLMGCSVFRNLILLYMGVRKTRERGMRKLVAARELSV